MKPFILAMNPRKQRLKASVFTTIADYLQKLEQIDQSERITCQSERELDQGEKTVYSNYSKGTPRSSCDKS